MKKAKWFFGILFVFVSLMACNKDVLSPDPVLEVDALKSTMIASASKGLTNVCGTNVTLPLLTNKAVQIGTVEIGNDETNLNVTYTTTVGTFSTLKLFIGNDLTTLPRSNGSGEPIWGQFPYKSGKEPYLPADGLTQYTFTIPLASLKTDFVFNETLFYFVARAEIVTNTENISALAGTKTNNTSKKSVIYDTYTININDFTVPADEASSVPCGTTLEVPILPVVTNACGTALTPSEPVITNNLIDGSGTVVYAYTYSDAAKHSHVWAYTYTIETCAKDAYAKGEYVFTDAAQTEYNPENLLGLNIANSQWGWAINQSNTLTNWVSPIVTWKITYWVSTGWGRGYSVQNGTAELSYDAQNVYIKLMLYPGNIFANSWTGRCLMTQVNGVCAYLPTPQINILLNAMGNPTPTTIYTETIPISSIPNYAGLGNPIYFRNEVGTNVGIAGFINPVSNYYTDQYINTIVPPAPVVSEVEYPIYMDAQNNNPANGVIVGKAIVKVNPVGDELRTNIKYVINAGYEMIEADMWVQDYLPTSIQQLQSEWHTYVNILDNVYSGLNFNIVDGNADGKLWIVCHAKVKTLY